MSSLFPGPACTKCNLCVKQILLLINCLMECLAWSVSPFVNCFPSSTRSAPARRRALRQRQLIGNNFTQTAPNGDLISSSLVTHSCPVTHSPHSSPFTNLSVFRRWEYLTTSNCPVDSFSVAPEDRTTLQVQMYQNCRKNEKCSFVKCAT